jgi:hypothetical protein
MESTDRELAGRSGDIGHKAGSAVKDPDELKESRTATSPPRETIRLSESTTTYETGGGVRPPT